MSEKKRVAFCICSYGAWSVPFRRNFIDFLIEQFKNRKYLFGYCESNGTYQHVAREEVANRALEEGAEYLFYIDTDSLLPLDALDKLMAHDVDIVSGLYYNRGCPYNAVAYQWTGEIDNCYQPNMIAPIMGDLEPKLYEVGVVGFGAVLIKASVFQKIKPPWFLPSANREILMGEDVFFCYKARQAGVKIYLDASVKVGHITDKSIIVTPDNYKKFRETEIIPARTHKIGDMPDMFSTGGDVWKLPPSENGKPTES